jgi:membrane protein DedA with SNARE-associated domain
VPAWKFIVFNFIGAAMWAPLIAGIGYLFGEIVESVLHDLKRAEIWLFAGLLAVGLLVFAIRHWRLKSQERG